ncbi:sulfite reductase flavoprotein subunit alpha [Pseudomonas sp. ABC1]|uniref:sulfite reductase subunit alpha n=1 Tax=Pseudomonas sp. ABC1 TaxID=2748080 RepID=UPI0015C3833E|nr:sulfite reductase flavoprotein subunit alpha [Pseudomonas sp. ABC1]QLF94736.1 sulfite reductase flavoprotein subunit alpha [Pseudomonas sp. ABC1]
MPASRTWTRHVPWAACLLLGVVLLVWQPAREMSASLVVLAYLGLCLDTWRRHRRPPVPATGGDLLIAYASQGGQALQIARNSAAQLQDAGVYSPVLSLEQLEPRQLRDYRQVLFIVSTYGEGEAPDSAARFERQLQAGKHALRDLHYAVLALGDNQYTHFCAFGRRLDTELRAQGALPLFDRLEADRCDAGTLRHWQQQLGHLSGSQDFSDWQAPDYQPWTLVERRCLNPGSAGAPLYLLTLQAKHGDWQAGDIAEIGPRHAEADVQALLQRLEHDPLAVLKNGETLGQALARRRLPTDMDSLRGLSPQALFDHLEPLPHREYSIASVPADGHLQLLVRQVQGRNGHPGLGSGWLCLHAPVGGDIDLRIRSNPGFHGPASTTPMILIGNGSGLAGLRAHLRERQRSQNAAPNWLLFGERNRAHDFLCQQELCDWLRDGHLQRLDLAFSRDQPERRYVQHVLRDNADELRRWVDKGAALYLCGSLEGMGREVQQILAGVLGEAKLQQLDNQGRYRRDLY